MTDTNFDETINVCSIGKYVNNIKGLDGSSASPTDTWVITFKDGVTFKNVSIKKGFLKIFVSPDSAKDVDMSIDNILNTKALQYEMRVYKDIITPLLDNKICPNFVKYLGRGINCTYNDLLKLLVGKLTHDGKTITTLLPALLKRNIYSIINKTPRLSIDDISNIACPTDYSLKKFLKFDIILNEAVQFDTLTKWLDLNFSSPSFNVEFWNIVFQICVACYSMSLSLLVHNDLHSGNIFIKDLGVSTNLLFYIDDKPVIINTRYIPLIYDFDRAYVKRKEFGENENLNSTLCSKTSQCNIFIPNKDIIKVFCYIFLYVRTERRNIINLFVPDGLSTDIVESYNFINIHGEKHCFLQYIDTHTHKVKSIPNEWYYNFYSCSTIINNIIRIHLTTYDLSTSVLPENIYHCNKRYFNPIDGKLMIPFGKNYEFDKFGDEDSYIISSIEKMLEDGMRKPKVTRKKSKRKSKRQLSKSKRKSKRRLSKSKRKSKRRLS